MSTSPATPIESFYAANCRSLMKLALYWVGAHDWDKAIDLLKAAIRSANRAKMLRTAGQCLVAIRRCQDAKKFYGALLQPVSQVA